MTKSEAIVEKVPRSENKMDYQRGKTYTIKVNDISNSNDKSFTFAEDDTNYHLKVQAFKVGLRVRVIISDCYDNKCKTVGAYFLQMTHDNSLKCVVEFNPSHIKLTINNKIKPKFGRPDSNDYPEFITWDFENITIE